MADPPDHFGLAADTLAEALRLTGAPDDPDDGPTTDAHALVRSAIAALRDAPDTLPALGIHASQEPHHAAAAAIVAGATLMHFRVTKQVLTPLRVLYGHLRGRSWNDAPSVIRYRLGTEPPNPVIPQSVSPTLNLPRWIPEDAVTEAYRTFLDAHALAEHFCWSASAYESDPTARRGVDAAVGAIETIRREARTEYSSYLGSLAQTGSPYDAVRLAGLRRIRTAQMHLGALLAHDADADADAWQAIIQSLQTGSSPVPDIEPGQQLALISGISTIAVDLRFRLWNAGSAAPIQIAAHDLFLHCLMITNLAAAGHLVPGALAAPPFPDLQSLHMLALCGSLTGHDALVAHDALQQSYRFATDAVVGVSAFEQPARRDALRFVARRMARCQWRLGRGLAVMRDLDRTATHS